MKISIETPTPSPTAGTVTLIPPHVSGGQNSDTCWVNGSNLITTRANTIQYHRPNDLCSASIIAKNYTSGLPDKKKIFLEKTKSNITRSSCIAWIWSYMEDNRMDTVSKSTICN